MYDLLAMIVSRSVNAICLAGLVGVTLVAFPARACVNASGYQALIHSALPTHLPRDMIVAEVEILSADEDALYRRGVPAHVLRVIQGHVPGDTLILRWPPPGSCARPFDNGPRGFVIAIVRGRAEAELLVEPFPALRGDDFRMRDGTGIPNAWRAMPAGW